MKNTSKDSEKYFLFNAYSNYDSNKFFISGSDRVGIELLKISKSKNFVLAPKNFQKYLESNNLIFIPTDKISTKILIVDYLLRTFFSIKYLFFKHISNASVISTSDFFCDTIPAFLFSGRNKWYAFVFHMYPFSFSPRNLLGILLQNFSFILFKNSFKVLTTNTECENFLRKNFRINQIQKINLGISLKKPKNISKDKIYDLIFVGRIKESKGVFLLPEIISRLKKNYPSIKVALVGNGSEEDINKLKSEISKFDITNHINVFHNLSDSSLSLKISESKYLIQLSSEEGFGLVIPEAISCGAGVVGFYLPVYEENFKDLDLNLVPYGDLDRLCKLIIKLLKSSKKVTTKDISRFNWKDIYDSIFDIGIIIK